ncbi:MAG: hypothetical protein GY835_05545 [bacterium]|nr:hypothetical protein [bacterium]
MSYIIAVTAAEARINVEMDNIPEDRLLAEDVRREVESALTFYPDDLLLRATENGQTLLVRVAPNQRQFFEWSGGRSPEWAAGLTIESGRVILLEKSYLRDRGRMRQLIRHEVAHAVLERLLRGQRVPHWFHEGFAQKQAAEWDIRAMGQLSLVGWLNRGIPLAEMERGFPAQGPRARLAYAEAQAAVLELAVDPERWNRLLHLLADGQSFDSALRSTIGMGLAAFCDDFDDRVMRRYRRLGFQYSGSVVLVVMIMLLIVGGLRARRRAVAVVGKNNGDNEQESFWRGRGWIDRGGEG